MTDQPGGTVADHRPNKDVSVPETTPVSQRDAGMRAVSYIISGIVVYGGIGWLIDRVWDQSWGVPTGLIVGMAFGVYLVIKRLGGQW